MDDRFDNRRYHNTDTFRVTSTAGAVQIKNEKGEVTLQKVKVERYISGKRPSYAKKQSNLVVSDNNDSEEDNFISQREGKGANQKAGNRDETETPFSNDDTDDCEMSEHEISITHDETSTNPINPESNIEDTVQDIAEVDDPRLKRLLAIKSEACQGNLLCSENKVSERASSNPKNPFEETYKKDGIK